MPIIFTITTELSCSSKLLYFSRAENIWIIQNGTFSLFDCYSSSFISCSSIVCSCSAWRLKHRRTAIYNERLHSLSSAKDNSLRIAFHDSMIPLSTIFYSSLPVVCRSETNISHGEVTTSAPSLRVCVFVWTRGESDKQKQYDDAVNTSPSVRNVVFLSACEWETLPYGVFFTDEALFSCRPCRYG